MTPGPKITLGALNDGQTLSNEEATTLFRICKGFEPEVADAAPVELADLSVVAFRCRSLEQRWLSHSIPLDSTPLTTPLDAVPEKEHAAHVASVAKLLERFSPQEILKGVRQTPPRRLSRYKEPYCEYTLVAEVDQRLEYVEEFIARVDDRLPGCFSWFDRESRHVTVRGLMPT